LPAGEMSREPQSRGTVEPDPLQSRHDLGTPLGPGHPAVREQRFFQGLPDGPDRIERGLWTLEDRLDDPGELAALGWLGAGHVLAGEPDSATGGLDQAEDRMAER
jgi:hypothetical protein